MPPYNVEPVVGSPPPMIQPGVPAYSFGSWNQAKPVVRMAVTNVALTSNVATLTVQVVEGYIPAVGDLISVFATTTSPPLFNVTNLALTAVSITASTGKGTVTFALTHANVASVADVGYALVKQVEVGDALVVGKGQQFAVQTTIGKGRGVTWAYTLPINPSTIAIQLEGAITDNDAEYTIIGTSQTTVTGYNTIIGTVPELVNWLRLNVTATTGGASPTIVGKILLS